MSSQVLDVEALPVLPALATLTPEICPFYT
jgi:hypothetical protein